jgi:hypothetical protein
MPVVRGCGSALPLGDLDRLDLLSARHHYSNMDNKQIVHDLLGRLPQDVSLHDIAREIDFVAAVREGVADLDRGQSVAIEEVEKELPSWIIR